MIEAHLGTPAVVRSVTTRHYPLNLDAKSGAFGLAVMNAAAMEVVVESVEVWGMRGMLLFEIHWFQTTATGALHFYVLLYLQWT